MENSMGWGEVLFGFHGRINRLTYWGGSLAVTAAGLAFAALLSWLATGDPLAPAVWQRPADQSGLWEPVWFSYFALIAWPMSALSVKRLHDRALPRWLWYSYFAFSVAMALVPMTDTLEAGTPASSGFLAAVLTGFSIFMFVQLSVLRGTPGPNPNGPDTLPPGFYGGDHDIWSVLFGLEGRLSRAQWWRGTLMVGSAALTVFFASMLFLDDYLNRHPEIVQNMNNRDWLKSDEARPVAAEIARWMFIPGIVFCVALWNLLALGVKRLHDRGLSGWLTLLLIGPFFVLGLAPGLVAQAAISEGMVSLVALLFLASLIWGLLQFGVLPGETGPNRYGPDPLAGKA
ncbi:DUF805 domain-containing protein [Rhodomicrobium sp. Az07]|uniref:DUF805 domain-containing protein n=1 Tax=Rhodomicrobium sp. Az07 TaxID=2839034 RepID=UPI001BE782CB|nr:DUF805 domain-containing protein [Rhodomicrobium sp. Az07]MBT3070883.1 DUF805 domain-containing protein [Rhodomicrobium sp. Az07]